MQKTSENSKKIPIRFLLFYFLLSVIFCSIYYIKIVEPSDWHAPNSINSVASLQTSKPYQFRLLIPFLFKLFEPFDLIHSKFVYMLYSIVIVFMIIVIYCKMLFTRYFPRNSFVFWISPVILYTMLWNYVVLNQSFQYYDFTAIMLFTAGLYYIVNENFFKLFIVFVLGILNKETAIYIVFAYLLYSYKSFLSKKVILNALLLIFIFFLWKVFLSYVFQANPGDDIEIGFYENLRIFKLLFTDRVLMKNFFFNFGGLYVFAVMLFIFGKWRFFKEKSLLYINLTVIPYYIVGFFVTYITEVRVYTELIPLITTMFLIYLSLNPRFFSYFYLKEIDPY